MFIFVILIFILSAIIFFVSFQIGVLNSCNQINTSNISKLEKRKLIEKIPSSNLELFVQTIYYPQKKTLKKSPNTLDHVFNQYFHPNSPSSSEILINIFNTSKIEEIKQDDEKFSNNLMAQFLKHSKTIPSFPIKVSDAINLNPLSNKNNRLMIAEKVETKPINNRSDKLNKFKFIEDKFSAKFIEASEDSTNLNYFYNNVNMTGSLLYQECNRVYLSRTGSLANMPGKCLGVTFMDTKLDNYIDLKSIENESFPLQKKIIIENKEITIVDNYFNTNRYGEMGGLKNMYVSDYSRKSVRNSATSGYYPYYYRNYYKHIKNFLKLFNYSNQIYYVKSFDKKMFSKNYKGELGSNIKEYDSLSISADNVNVFIKKRRSVITLVLNQGVVDLFINFMCSIKHSNIYRDFVDNTVIFIAQSNIRPIIESLGLKVFDASVFGEIPSTSSTAYGDTTFGLMMWLKAVTLSLSVSSGFNVLFQDVDLIWLKDPLSYLENLLNTVVNLNQLNSNDIENYFKIIQIKKVKKEMSFNNFQSSTDDCNVFDEIPDSYAEFNDSGEINEIIKKMSLNYYNEFNLFNNNLLNYEEKKIKILSKAVYNSKDTFNEISYDTYIGYSNLLSLNPGYKTYDALEDASKKTKMNYKYEKTNLITEEDPSSYDDIKEEFLNLNEEFEDLDFQISNEISEDILDPNKFFYTSIDEYEKNYIEHYHKKKNYFHFKKINNIQNNISYKNYKIKNLIEDSFLIDISDLPSEFIEIVNQEVTIDVVKTQFKRDQIVQETKNEDKMENKPELYFNKNFVFTKDSKKPKMFNSNQVMDILFMDDGARSGRFAPYYSNSGFYYLRYSKKAVFFVDAIIRRLPQILFTKSHQAILTTALIELSDQFNFRIGLLPQDLFPSGFLYHHNKTYIKNLLNHEVFPYLFHMCWTESRKQKLEYFKNIDLWQLDEKCELYENIDKIFENISKQNIIIKNKNSENFKNGDSLNLDDTYNYDRIFREPFTNSLEDIKSNDYLSLISDTFQPYEKLLNSCCVLNNNLKAQYNADKDAKITYEIN